MTVKTRLPRGPHGLSREDVVASQRTRMLSAVMELMAACGYADVRVGDVAKRAGVSRATFYEHFADKESCVLAAYDEYTAGVSEQMIAGIDSTASHDDPLSTFIHGYLGALQRDLTAARAVLVEMDGAGPVARERRRAAVHTYARLLAEQHKQRHPDDPRSGPLLERVYFAFALAVREKAAEELLRTQDPDLVALAPDLVELAHALVGG